ncbi:hypothetical protein T484DRAFT_2811014 [Baffinella frigidus]|nr:hypothetical protein T484DRAFT_2811014 [Cryptophyta sp. CCMP2293]
MVSRHAALIAFLFALAASVLPSPRTATHVACARPCVLHTLSARSPGNLRCAVGGEQAVLARATGDGQQMADWLGTECGVLNAQQLLQVVALFTADENGVLTRGGLASLTEEDVADMLSPLPRLSRRVVASAAASLRKSHADAMANANEKEKGMAKAHVHSLRTTGSRRILSDVTGASLPRWGADPSVAACALDATWGDLVRGRADGTGATFEAGGLGGLTEDPNFGVWLCQDGHACANGTSSFFCFVYDEVAKRFVAWGPNSQLHLVRDCGAGYFFDATCVNSPTNYVYPSTYTTRTLVHPKP